MTEGMVGYSCLKRWIKAKTTLVGGLISIIILLFLLLYLRIDKSHNLNNLKFDQPMTLTSTKATLTLKTEDHFVVPNIVHYVWIGDYEPMRFHHFLSVKSVYKHLKPERIIFHCDNEPTGKWWKQTKNIIKTLRIRKLIPPSEIFGNEVIKPEHKSDIARMEILMTHGGIYVDTDVFVIKSFDPLRKYNFTMGIEYHGNPGRLNNGVIVARKGAAFLQKWNETYRNFTKREWDFHDSIIPYYLQFHYPELIHVEAKTINWPSGQRLDLIYDKVYDWSNNYCMHLWYRLHGFDHTPNDIKRMDTTFGQLARLIYYGSSDIIDE